jgi:hypothetical protein
MKLINKKVLETLEQVNDINLDQSLLYLLALYFDLSTECIPEEIIRKVNSLDIVTRDFSNEQPAIKWIIPLFEDNQAKIEDNWSWVEDYRKKFAEIKSEARGDKQGTLKKMKRFFADNPHVRMDEVIEAADEYLDRFRQGMDNPKYCQQADYFISKRDMAGGSKSRLEMFLEIIREKREKSNLGDNPRHQVIS